MHAVQNFFWYRVLGQSLEKRWGSSRGIFDIKGGGMGSRPRGARIVCAEDVARESNQSAGMPGSWEGKTMSVLRVVALALSDRATEPSGTAVQGGTRTQKQAQKSKTCDASPLQTIRRMSGSVAGHILGGGSVVVVHPCSL